MAKAKYCEYCGKKIGIFKKWEFSESKPIHIKCKEQKRIAKIEREVAEEQKEYVERIMATKTNKKHKNIYFRRLMYGETETSAKGGLESLPKDEPDVYEMRRKKEMERIWGLKKKKD